MTRSEAWSTSSATCSETDLRSFEAVHPAQADGLVRRGPSAAGRMGGAAVARRLRSTRSSTTRSMSIVASSIRICRSCRSQATPDRQSSSDICQKSLQTGGSPVRRSGRPIRPPRPYTAPTHRQDNTSRQELRIPASGRASGRCCPARSDRPRTARSLQRKGTHQFPAADLEKATVAQGEGHQAVAAEAPRCGSRRPANADVSKVEKAPIGNLAFWNQARFLVSMLASQRCRCRCSQARLGRVVRVGTIGHDRSARIAAQGPENRADDTPSAIAAIWCSLSMQQAS